ncbi:MAG: hypothetical protein MZU95_13495 [Desulfomicrobium escambiense]|nr:hypothetical protein [Desulfomicrobium escambiense]
MLGFRRPAHARDSTAADFAQPGSAAGSGILPRSIAAEALHKENSYSAAAMPLPHPARRISARSIRRERTRMSYETLLFQVEQGIATITFNRPKALNAINRALLGELADALGDGGGRRGHPGAWC